MSTLRTNNLESLDGQYKVSISELGGESVPSILRYGDDASAEAEAFANAPNSTITYPDHPYNNISPPVSAYPEENADNAYTGRIRTGTEANPVNKAQPVMWVEKFTNSNRDEFPQAWDMGAIQASLVKRGGDAYSAAVSTYVDHQEGSGDSVALHSRARLRDPEGRAYAGWFYTAVDPEVGTDLRAAHALELNGHSRSSHATHMGNSQLMRLTMADSADTENRFSSAITIGEPTFGGLAGFLTGMVFEQGSVTGTSGTGGEGASENILMEGGVGGRPVGGIRFSNPTSEFRYGLAITEGNYQDHNAIVIQPGLKIRWGSLSNSSGPSLTAGSTSVTVDNGHISVQNSVNNVGLAVNGVNVVKSRRPGWGISSSQHSRAAFDADVINVQQLAQRVKALIFDLADHGLIGT